MNVWCFRDSDKLQGTGRVFATIWCLDRTGMSSEGCGNGCNCWGLWWDIKVLHFMGWMRRSYGDGMGF